MVLDIWFYFRVAFEWYLNHIGYRGGLRGLNPPLSQDNI
jgi:hypothetical protein